MLKIKKSLKRDLFDLLAEKEGFEPPEVLPSTVFKTAAFDHSAISPGVVKVLFFINIASAQFIIFMLELSQRCYLHIFNKISRKL